MGVGVAHAGHADARPRVSVPERREQVFDDRGVHGELAVGELERGAAILGRLARARYGAGRRFQRHPGVGEERLPRSRELNSPRQTLKQRDPQLPLEITDLLREGGLGDPQAPGGLHEGSLFGD